MNYVEALGLLNNTQPARGGLLASNYNNPYGLRAHELKDKRGSITNYIGEMLPKSVGWLGLLEGMGKLRGSKVTEYSMDDEKGSFPTVVPTLDEYERISVANGIITPTIYRKAIEWRDLMQENGLSPFYNESWVK